MPHRRHDCPIVGKVTLTYMHKTDWHLTLTKHNPLWTFGVAVEYTACMLERAMIIDISSDESFVKTTKFPFSCSKWPLDACLLTRIDRWKIIASKPTDVLRPLSSHFTCRIALMFKYAWKYRFPGRDDIFRTGYTETHLSFQYKWINFQYDIHGPFGSKDMTKTHLRYK